MKVKTLRLRETQVFNRQENVVADEKSRIVIHDHPLYKTTLFLQDRPAKHRKILLQQVITTKDHSDEHRVTQ